MKHTIRLTSQNLTTVVTNAIIVGLTIGLGLAVAILVYTQVVFGGVY